MNNKVLILKKSGHNLWAEVNPVTKKLNNFSVSGHNTNPKYTYSNISEAESAFNRCVGSANK